MAIFKFVNESYPDKADMRRLIDYCNKKAVFVHSNNMAVYSANIIYSQFLYCKKYFFKEEGCQLLHFVLSFDGYWERWVSWQTAEECAVHLCDLFEGYQTAAFVHPKKGQLHIHFLVNTVSFLTGNRFHLNTNTLTELTKEAALWLYLEHIALLSVSYISETGALRFGRHDEDSLYLNKPGCNMGFY